MHRRAALACSTLLLAVGCSDGSGPSLGATGVFSAQLTGAQSASLSGNAEAGLVFTEDGSAFSIRMFAQEGEVLRFVILNCPGDTAPASGTYALGPGGACQARYGRVPSSSNFVVTETAEADAGSLRITTSNDEEVDGVFTFHGQLVETTDTIGGVSATGTFRAKVF